MPTGSGYLFNFTGDGIRLKAQKKKVPKLLTRDYNELEDL